MALQGEIFRAQKGRVTQRIILGDKAYFIKQHAGVGWREVIKNLLHARLPVMSARQEWQAIQKITALGVAAPKVVGYGERGCLPATRESFILMEELAPAISLEDLCRHWKQSPPDFIFKRDLISKVATIARILHTHGVNHRDFYICHFLMLQNASANTPLYLIDLHRAELRRKTPARWIIKDLAGLYFSSKDIGLTRHDYYRFMTLYSNKSLRDVIQTEALFWQKVKTRGDRLYRDHQKR